MWGEEYRGIPVKDLFSVKEENSRILWIISCRFAYDEIAGKLKNMGVDGQNILHYRNWYEERMYLLSLAEESYRYEIDKIADLEFIRLIEDRVERKRYVCDIIQKPSVYAEEYAYLEEKYGFQYWLKQETENENICYYSMPE